WSARLRVTSNRCCKARSTSAGQRRVTRTLGRSTGVRAPRLRLHAFGDALGLGAGRVGAGVALVDAALARGHEQRRIALAGLESEQREQPRVPAEAAEHILQAVDP